MKKNYFLRTAILLVALLCGTSAWAVSLTQDVTFNDWSKVTGSSYDASKGEQIFVGSDGVDYTWTFVQSVMRENTKARIQLKGDKGVLLSPTFETSNGFDVTITFDCTKNDASITETGTDNTVQGASPLTLSVTSPSASITIEAGSAATYITQIDIKPIASSSLQNPELAFTDITGDVTKQLTEGSYSSAATTVSDATITYSSSDTEVATINQKGLVTLVAGGTTVIKAEVAETETFDAASVEYTLTVIDPATAKIFTKISSIDELTDGKYVIAYGTAFAMNNTNAGNFFRSTNISTVDGSIINPDNSIVWDIKTTEIGSTISNGDVFVYCSGEKNVQAKSWADGDNKFYWAFTESNGEFITKSVGSSTDLYLKYNATYPRFTTYKAGQEDLTLYRLNDGKQDVKVTFNEVSGNKELFFAEGLTYNSAATATPEKPITYSSSDQEVATISTEGLVSVVGPGTTIIKATTEADDTYREGIAQYTLTVRASSATLPHSIDFKSGLGDWLTYTPMGTTNWESTKYGAQANGYNKGEGETYLISPAVEATSIVLSFGSKFAFSGPAAQLFYSSNFDPNTMEQPSEADWTEITEMATWATSEETTPSGDIELKDLTEPIRFAFKYTCSDADGAARWTITDLMIKEGTATGIASVEVAGMKIIGGKGQVTIEASEAATVAVYALTGAQVRQIELTEGSNIVTLPAGIYIIGNQKVVVF